MNTPKERVCLKCNKWFNSTHKGNRLCKECGKNNRQMRHTVAKHHPHGPKGKSE